jgi:hypothetical protein
MNGSFFEQKNPDLSPDLGLTKRELVPCRLIQAARVLHLESV